MNIYFVDNPAEVWPELENGLAKIREKTNVPVFWQPFDVLLMLLKNAAQAFIIEENGRRAGFFVIRKMVEEFTQKPYLLLWLIHKEPWATWDLLNDVWAFLVKEGKHQGVHMIMGLSSREGWKKPVEKAGGKPWMTIYFKEI